MNIYIGTFIAAVIVWNICYQYYIYREIDKISNFINDMNVEHDKSIRDMIHRHDSLSERYSNTYYLVNAMSEDLKDIRHKEQRRHLAEQYGEMAARYKKLSKEYSSES